MVNIFNLNCLRNNVYHLADPIELAEDEDDPIINLNTSESTNYMGIEFYVWKRKRERIANISNLNCVRNNVYHLADPREPADDEDDPVIKLNASGSKDDS